MPVRQQGAVHRHGKRGLSGADVLKNDLRCGWEQVLDLRAELKRCRRSRLRAPVRPSGFDFEPQIQVQDIGDTHLRALIPDVNRDGSLVIWKIGLFVRRNRAVDRIIRPVRIGRDRKREHRFRVVDVGQSVPTVIVAVVLGRGKFASCVLMESNSACKSPGGWAYAAAVAQTTMAASLRIIVTAFYAP